MIAAFAAILLAADPCAPPMRAAPDAALAAVYEQVAHEEAGRGARDAAVVAWLRAAELQAAGGSADAALAALCAFDRAGPLVEAGRCGEALPLLARARQGPDAPVAAELERACTEGREAALTAWLRLKPTELRAHRAEGKDRLAFELAAEGGYDSNAMLVPLTGGFAHDGFAAGTALLGFRPFGADGPFLVAGGGYRKQLLFPQSDVGLATGTLGWEHRLGPVRASLDGGLDWVSLGGMPWLLRGRGTVAALARFGNGFAGVGYTLAHEQLWAEPAREDTGLRHWGEAEAGVGLGAYVLALAAQAQRVSAREAHRSSTEAGGELRATVRSSDARKTFDLGLGGRWRGFDAMDPDLLVLRREAQLDVRMAFDFALDPRLAVFVSLESRLVFSSVPELTYARATASLGMRMRVDLW